MYLLKFKQNTYLLAFQPSSTTSSTTNRPISTTEAPDIYIDDESRIEGSGISNVKDDLESSGSGFGPDDEDGYGAGAPKNKGKIFLF
ncbi:hypothetical protein WDU94_004952 [Cyamophila willieti]